MRFPEKITIDFFPWLRAHDVIPHRSGVNNVHILHPIFNLGRDENAGKSPYQIVTASATQQPDEATEITTHSVATNDVDELDAAHHRNRSIRRQKSIKRRLESGSSLSDAHSNTWPSEEEETEDIQKDKAMHRAELWGKRQTHRRQALQDRIEHGKALSNSTGGHWSDEK